MSTPLIDVLLPVFNGAEFLRSSLRSIQDQSIENIKIHVVNDGSTDSTLEILDEISRQDARVVVHNQENTGIVGALNNGLAHCTAEFVARHDADDLAYPQRFQEQIDLLRANLDVVAVGGSARHIDEHGLFMGTTASLTSPEKADPNSIPAIEPYLLHPFLMVRREAIVGVGGYRYAIHAEDSDLYWRLQEKGKLYGDKKIQGEYRIHSASISSQSVRNGRVSAVSSQLCALSAARRRAGREDLIFSPQAGADLKQASGSLSEACELISKDLTSEEQRHIRIAVAAKLLETTSYRPYELELSDCQFMRRAFDESRSLIAPADRSPLTRMFAGTAARLSARGHPAEARALLPPGMYVSFALRLIFRRLASRKIRKKVKWLIGLITSTDVKAES